MASLEDHINIATAHYVSVLLLCICGMLLNIVMLVVFCTRKVRGSVYTTYMIQIAITDLFICLAWLVMTAMYIDDLPSASDVRKTYNLSKGEDAAQRVEDQKGLETRNFSVYRFTYAVYNFHYYNNIFLLAAMSVERFVAVWKSLRCQKYQFNRKFIYGVSFVMWLLALVCALPSFIDPNLITNSEREDLLQQTVNNTGYANIPTSSALLECYKPLQHATENNATVVTDYDGVSAADCIEVMTNFGERYNHMLEDILRSDGALREVDYIPTNGSYDTEEEQYANYFSSAYYPPEYDEAYETDIQREDYMTLFHMSSRLVTILAKTEDIDGLCDPQLTTEAKYYQITVNLVIGFFIPFTAIVFTNLGIALMIGKRAKHRLGNENGDEGHVESGGRMTAFLKQFGHLSSSRVDVDSVSYRKGSPPIVRKKAKRRSNQQEVDKNETNIADENDNQSNKKRLQANITLQPATPTKSPNRNHIIKRREQRPQLKAFPVSPPQHRTSGGSASSAESFPTDLTSLHTSPSPGVRLSVPTFHSPEGRARIQRACSADSSGSGGSSSQPIIARRWSSEVFRHCATLEDRSHATQERKYRELTCEHPEERKAKFDGSLSPTRGEQPTFESTQELLLAPGNTSRTYTAKTKKYSRQLSSQSNIRSRAYSAASSRGGTMRKTIVHKNAERQMRVSKTVLAYVVVFSICWLPQRIVTIWYFTEGLVEMGGYFCHIASSTTRIISFFSVLLNPIVYAVTQRELRHLIRQAVNKLCKCICPHVCLKKSSSPKPIATPCGENGVTGIVDKPASEPVMPNISTDDLSRQERHVRNRERWSRLVHRLGRKNFPWSFSASGGVSMHGEKPSDGTIDEEKEEENKGQSSSNSFKLTNGINGWDDWQQLLDMAATKGENSQRLQPETIL